MRFVGHTVHVIAATQLRKDAVRQWLGGLGVSDEAISSLVDDGKSSEAAHLVRLAGKRCYLAFEKGLNPNISRVRDDMAEYIDHILDSGHGSVLEHVNYTFAIEGLSRVCTAELNRHRAGVAISEQSMRYVRLEDIPFYLPPCLQGREAGDQDYKEKETLRTIGDLLYTVEAAYKKLQLLWADELAPASKFGKKKEITSLLRRIIPMGVATGGVWTFNFRALRHILERRCAPDAEEEIRSLGMQMLSVMMREQLVFFGDFNADNGKPKYSKV